MMIIRVTEIILPSCNHIIYHRFNLTQAWEGGYREVMSYNAFFNGMKKYNWKRKEKLFSANREDEPSWALVQNIPLIIHKDIWEFYKDIGWDWQKKKWTK